MNKKIISAIFLISMMILVGCSSNTTTPSKTIPYVGGSESIDFNFMADEPPDEALDQDQLQFVVTVSLENRGEWDVAKEDVNIELRGFRPADFNNPEIQKNPDENLEKTYMDTDGNTIPGTLTHVTFDGFSYVGELKANNLFPIVADICYEYGTESQFDLCYLKDLTDKNQVCEVREEKSTYSSSGPVGVENVKEDLGGSGKISFTFDIVHRGTGSISKLGTACNEEDQHIDKNKVWVEVDTELEGLECTSLTDGTATSGYVTLYGGKRSVRCTQTNPGDGDYVKKAYATLTYEYKEIKKTEILIKHLTE